MIKKLTKISVFSRYKFVFENTNKYNQKSQSDFGPSMIIGWLWLIKQIQRLRSSHVAGQLERSQSGLADFRAGYGSTLGKTRGSSRASNDTVSIGYKYPFKIFYLTFLFLFFSDFLEREALPLYLLCDFRRAPPPLRSVVSHRLRWFFEEQMAPIDRSEPCGFESVVLFA